MNNVIIRNRDVCVLDEVVILCDVSSNHGGSIELFSEMCDHIETEGGIVKVQLYNENTFPSTFWSVLPHRYVPSVFRPQQVQVCMDNAHHRPLAWKIASVESTYYELIAQCMETKLPIVVSTGGMNDVELAALMRFVWDYEHGLCIMHCVSSYPTRVEDANLGRIATIASVMEEYMVVDGVLGWSSHLGTVDPIAYGVAVSLGVTVFELHVQMGHSPARNEEERSSSVVLPHAIYGLNNTINRALELCGSGDVEGVDRNNVLEWRRRWQH